MRAFWIQWLFCGFSAIGGVSVAARAEAPTEVSSPPPVTLSGINGPEKAAIYQQFRKKLRDEEKAFDAEEKIQRKALIRHQADRRREWRERERRARRAFFEAHASGPERRRYVQDFVRRRKEFDQQEKNEWVDWNRKHRDLRKQLRVSQQERTRQVNEALSRNERP
jgi:hypothetical protein